MNIFKKRGFLLTTLGLLAVLSTLVIHPAGAATQDQGVLNFDPDETRKVLFISNGPKSNWRYVSWFLQDPLVLSEFPVIVEVNEVQQPDLSIQVLAPFDLVVLHAGQHIDEPVGSNLAAYLNQGGALLLMGTTIESPTLQKNMEKRGISVKATVQETAPYSVITDHKATRILGVPQGSSVYPHRMYEPHYRYDVDGGDVLTRLGYKGDPDLFVSGDGKVAVCATHVLMDIAKHHSSDQGYFQYRRQFGMLLVNTARRMLGLEYFVQPVQLPQQRANDFFYAYGAGRAYISHLQVQEPFSQRLSKQELDQFLLQADDHVIQAARYVVSGDFASWRSHYDEAISVLEQVRKQMTDMDIYAFQGWHSSMLFDHYYGGGSWGVAEAEWMDNLLSWMQGELKMLKRSNSRRIMNIYPNDWEILAKYYDQEVEIFKEGISDGYLENGHGIYSAAFLPVLSGESNIRQFHYGLKVFDEVLDAKVTTYIDPIDHFSLHPQLPQIIENFGYENAIVRASHDSLGIVKRFPFDKILWRGLDGTQVPAVPEYDDVPFPYLGTWGILNPETLATADQAGHKAFLAGFMHDATWNKMGQREHSFLNYKSTPTAKWVTFREFFEKTANIEPGVVHFYSADDLHSYKLELWTSVGNLNEAHAWNRDTENTIVAAETFSAIANVLDHKESAGHTRNKFDTCWKRLLRTQDHMAYGPINYSRQIPAKSMKPAEAKGSKHWWGYAFDPLPSNQGIYGVMENYAEYGTDNYAGPMIPITRYDKVRQLHDQSRNQAYSLLTDAVTRILADDADHVSKDESGILFSVFNPLGWQKHEPVIINQSFAPKQAHGFAITDGVNNVPHQILEGEIHPDGSLKRVRVLCDVQSPSVGYKTYIVNPEPAVSKQAAVSLLHADATRLENTWFIVEIDTLRGGIRQIRDKQRRVNLLNTSAHPGAELFSATDPEASSTDAKPTIRVVETGPVRATVQIQSEVAGLPYECTISLYSGSRHIELTVNIDYGTGLRFGDVPRNETGLTLLFPLSDPGRRYINLPFGVYEVEKDKQVTGDFVYVDQGRYGICLSHRNTPIHHYDNGMIRFVLSRGQRLVVGKQEYRFALTTHDGGVSTAELLRTAQGWNTPLIVHRWSGKLQDVPHERSFLSIDQPNVLLSTLYMKDGDLLARFYEAAGQNTETTVQLPLIDSDMCTQVKLNGDKIRDLNIVNNTLKLNFSPWRIVTTRFEH